MKHSSHQIVIYKSVAFFAAWILLSQSYNAFHLTLGLVVSWAVAWLNTPNTQSPFMDVRWSRLVIYGPWLLGRIIQSGVHLSFLILHPRLPIDPKFIEYNTNLRQKAGVVLLGNSITLTPGTITADINSRKLLVHTMDDKAAHDLTSHRMEQTISTYFGFGEERK